MRDFFDEDFPLSAKQEEEYKKRQEELEAEKAKAEETPDAFDDDYEQAYSEPIDEAFTISPEVEFAEDDEPYEMYYAGMSETEEIFEALTQDEPEAVEEVQPEEPEAVEEIVEQDPIDSAPIFSLELDEPLDDGFLPDAPIIISEEEPECEEIPEEEDDLSAELRSLTEKLDSMERAVNAMNAPAGETDDDDEPANFSYEYDERYFAEEETTAYKHPELVKKPAVKPAAKAKKASSGDMTINLKTLAKVGAVVAGAVVAAKLLSDDKKK